MQLRFKYVILTLLAAAFTGCALVDEDMRDCETDYHINYELKLVTNISTEIQTQLGMDTNVEVATALETYFLNVFKDYAHDVDLSFYDVNADSLRLHHETHVMNANQSSYTLYIPVRKYMHVAVANLDETPGVHLTGDEKCHTAALMQEVRDTVESYKTGIFAARLDMDIKEGVNQAFDVHLYTVNSAHAILVDTLGSHIKGIRVYASGFATGLNLADSTFRYTYTPVVRTEKVEVGDTPGNPLCYAAVTLPSRMSAETKAADEAIWRYKVYTDLPDGSVTETILGVKFPVEAGQVKLIKCSVDTDGAIVPLSVLVGASVTTDWNPGSDWDIEI